MNDSFLTILDNKYLLKGYQFTIEEISDKDSGEYSKFQKISKEKLLNLIDTFGGLNDFYEWNKLLIWNSVEDNPKIFRLKFSNDKSGKFSLGFSKNVNKLYFSQKANDYSSFDISIKEKSVSDSKTFILNKLKETNFTLDTNPRLMDKSIKEDLVSLWPDSEEDRFLDFKELKELKQLFWYSMFKEVGFNILDFPLYSKFLHKIGLSKQNDGKYIEELLVKINKQIEMEKSLVEDDAFTVGYEPLGNNFPDNWINNLLAFSKSLDKTAVQAIYLFKLMEFLPLNISLLVILNPEIMHDFKKFNNFFNSLNKNQSLKLKYLNESEKLFKKILKKYLYISLDESVTSTTLKEVHNFQEDNFLNKNCYILSFLSKRKSEIYYTIHSLQSLNQLDIKEIESIKSNSYRDEFLTWNSLLFEMFDFKGAKDT